MPPPLVPKVFLISVVSSIISATFFTHSYSQCLDDQKILLLELKNEFIFNSFISRKLVQWNQTDECCNWYGVECDGAGHVISLQLNDEAISGGIEDSSSLFRLKYLEKLNLAWNDVFKCKTQIPRGIQNLSYLTHLDLSYAGFGGQIPLELSLLRRLVSLDICNSFWFFDSDDCSLEGHFPEMIFHIPTLQSLDVSYNQLLSGTIPPFTVQSGSLESIKLLRTNFSGSIPSSISNLKSLSELELYYSKFTGSIPSTYLLQYFLMDNYMWLFQGGVQCVPLKY